MPMTLDDIRARAKKIDDAYQAKDETRARTLEAELWFDVLLGVAWKEITDPVAFARAAVPGWEDMRFGGRSSSIKS